MEYGYGKIWCLLLITWGGSVLSPVLAWERESFVYKEVDGISIEADVYSNAGDGARPVLLWIHGGGLMNGNRGSVPPQLVMLCKDEDYVLVSIDYRLAPETKLSGIVDDLKDALQWVRDQGGALFNADGDRIVVAGASAGGYLALMSGIVAEPAPGAIVSYWGYGDILGDWCTKANPGFGGKQPTPSREEAFAGVGDRAITGTTQKESGERGNLFLYMKRLGLWTKLVSGIDPNKSPEALVPYCPIRHMEAGFPPLLLLHGTSDPDVPVEQSIEMHGALKEINADVELITVEGGGHGLWGGDREEIESAFDQSLEFIRAQLGGD
jgi:acetyl esterase/lipase